MSYQVLVVLAGFSRSSIRVSRDYGGLSRILGFTRIQQVQRSLHVFEVLVGFQMSHQYLEVLGFSGILEEDFRGLSWIYQDRFQRSVGFILNRIQWGIRCLSRVLGVFFLHDFRCLTRIYQDFSGLRIIEVFYKGQQDFRGLSRICYGLRSLSRILEVLVGLQRSLDILVAEGLRGHSKIIQRIQQVLDVLGSQRQQGFLEVLARVIVGLAFQRSQQDLVEIMYVLAGFHRSQQDLVWFLVGSQQDYMFCLSRISDVLEVLVVFSRTVYMSQYILQILGRSQQDLGLSLPNPAKGSKLLVRHLISY